MGIVAAIRHVHFENLGTFENVFSKRGYTIVYHDPDSLAEWETHVEGAEILVILGGPIGVYNQSYPSTTKIFRILEKRLRSDAPTIGLCLGAQLIASTLGATVFPNSRKEIGWAPVKLTKAGEDSALRHLGPSVSVLHWHGDTFDLPMGAELLASTEITRNQAFNLGKNILGLQFHPEVDGNWIEPWLVGHACELSLEGISIELLRAASRAHADGLRRHAAAMLTEWLDGLLPVREKAEVR